MAKKLAIKNIKDQKGASLTDYSLTVALIVLVAIVSINAVGDAARIKLEVLAKGLEGGTADDNGAPAGPHDPYEPEQG